MEEILSSIRRIISEEGAPQDAPSAVATPAPPADPAAADNDDFDALTAEDVLSARTETVEEVDDLLDEFDEFDAFDDLEEVQLTADPATGAPVEPPADAAEPSHPPFETRESIEPTPAPYPSQPTHETEPEMPATAKYQQTVLTEEETADRAAGALGKLIASMDLGGENTIEALVREILKPMIKDWLDTNLPGIVERQVEAEVQRIAKMAR